MHSCGYRLSFKVGSIFSAVFETRNASRFATFYRFVAPQPFNTPSRWVTLHATTSRFVVLPPCVCALAQTSGVASVIANNRILRPASSKTKFDRSFEWSADSSFPSARGDTRADLVDSVHCTRRIRHRGRSARRVVPSRGSERAGGVAT